MELLAFASRLFAPKFFALLLYLFRLILPRERACLGQHRHPCVLFYEAPWHCRKQKRINLHRRIPGARYLGAVPVHSTILLYEYLASGITCAIYLSTAVVTVASDTGPLPLFVDNDAAVVLYQV